VRAAAILGLGCSEKDLRPFQKASPAEWLIGLPASSSEADVILLFGGDGTVHRHLGALVKLGLPVLVVPCGSGNDFARALELRRVRDSLAVWQRFASGGGNVRAIDLGVITPLPASEPQGQKPTSTQAPVGTAEAVPFPVKASPAVPSPATPAPDVPFPAKSPPSPHSYASRNSKLETGNSKYFCCVGGIGLDAEVARRANKLPRWLRGHGGYALSLPPALLGFAPPAMRVSVRDSDGWVLRNAGPTVLAAFANAPAYGGGMKIAPHAKLDDGQLDICLINDIGRLKVLSLFPTVYLGRHLAMRDVAYFQSSRLQVETEHPLDVYADGEFVCQTPVDVSVARSAFRVICP
jgi:diacylglycerol kinase family enzyme